MGFLSGSAAITWCRFTGEALMMGVRNGAALLSPFLDRGTGPQRIKVTSCCSKRLSCLPSNRALLYFLETSPPKSSPRRIFLTEKNGQQRAGPGRPGPALLISFSRPEIRDSTMLGLGLVLDSLGVRLMVSVFSFCILVR